jgi:AcrR family transcriptional regulator
MSSYSSPLRERQARQTRRRIAQAALRLFTQKGYSGTSIAEIAGAAGVAVQTIYATYGSKRNIVLALVDAIDELADIQPLVQRVLAETDPRALLRLEVQLTRRFREGKVGRVVSALDSAAQVDPELTAAAAEGRRRHRRGAELVAQRLADLGALAPSIEPEDAAAAISVLTSPASYAQLAAENAWSLDECERWLADTLEQLLLAPGRRRPRR